MPLFGRQDAASEGPGQQREGKVVVELLTNQERYNVSQQNGTHNPTFVAKQQERWGAMQWWKKTLIILSIIVLLFLIIFVLIIMIRAATVKAPPMSSKLSLFSKMSMELVDDGRQMERAQRLAGALKIATVSSQEPKPEDDKFFYELHTYIRKSFPRIHNSSFIRRDVINQKSLLYTVTGTNPDKLPYMLCSHLDVVPADPTNWEVPPFGGLIVNDTYIYGRGALDDKGGVMGILEAVEYMISKGERPQRSFFLAFGHDEEVSGKSGALEIAKELQRKGTNRLDFIVDEGHPITHNVFPGTDQNVALIGVSEKGSLTLQLKVQGTPGHSSFPPWETSIVILADAVSRVEKHKVPAEFGEGPEKYTFEYLAPHVSFGYRLLYSNMWLFGDSMISAMERVPQTNAMVRTTTAVTIFNGGFKNNVVPATATAVINHRIHPAQSVKEILRYDKKVIDDPRVEIEILGSREPHPTSPFGTEDLAYQTVKTSIEQTFPDTVVVPGVLIANTDMGQYLNFTENIYRFFPSIMEPSDLGRYHGNNERISIQHYSQAVNFYYRLIKNSELIIDNAPNIST